MSQFGTRPARPRIFHQQMVWGFCVLSGLFFSSACGYVGLDFSDQAELVKIEGGGGSPPAAGGIQEGSGGKAASGGVSALSGGRGGEDSLGTGGDEASGAGGDAQGGTGGEAALGNGGNDSVGTGGDDGAGGSSTVEVCLAGCDDYSRNFFILHNTGSQGASEVSLVGNGSYDYVQTVWRGEGNGSIELRTELPGDEAEISTTIPLVSNGEIHFRAWVLLPEALSSDWVKVFGLNGSDSDGPQVRMDKEGRLSIYLPESDESWESAPGAYPVDEWFCLQIVVKLDDAEGAMDVRVNGASVLLVEGADTKPDAGVRVVVYGLAEIGPGPSENLIYFDRVRGAVGAPPCDNESDGSGRGWFGGSRR
jgi:hypothetical protein